jgi:Leucine-rich repeat (LRR) protein
MLTRELLEKCMYKPEGKNGLLLHYSRFMHLNVDDQVLLITFLQEHKEITKLSIRYIPIESSTIAALSTIESLTELRLSHCGLTTQDAIALAAMPNLILLDIPENPEIGNEGLAALAKSKSLKILKMEDCGITSLAGLAGTSIEEIDTSYNPIADQGLQTSEEIDTSSNPITDQGPQTSSRSQRLFDSKTGLQEETTPSPTKGPQK